MAPTPITPAPSSANAALPRQAWSVLIVSTLAFTVCFMVWMRFGVIGISLKQPLNLNATEFGLLTATPMLTGSLIRVPLGMRTDKNGGRIVMAVLMAATVPAIHLMAHATDYGHFSVIGLFVGLAGGRSSVGTPDVARWFPRHRQGLAMGVGGAGNSGAKVNRFLAPALLVAFGWTMVPQVDAAVTLGTLTIFWFGSSSGPAHLVPSQSKFGAEMKALPVLQHRLWRRRRPRTGLAAGCWRLTAPQDRAEGSPGTAGAMEFGVLNLQVRCITGTGPYRFETADEGLDASGVPSL